MTITHKEFMESLDTPEQWRHQRDEFAAALALALSFLGKIRTGLMQMDGEQKPRHWANLDHCISQVQEQLADPGACLKAQEEKDAGIRQLRNLLAEAARKLLRSGIAESNAGAALEIATFLGYESGPRSKNVDAFLAGVSVEEPIT